MILTQLISRAVINMSTPNNNSSSVGFDVGIWTPEQFFGIVVEALVTVSQRTKGQRGSPNWARGHLDMDIHLIALKPGYFKRL
jgi:hypothetical protein